MATVGVKGILQDSAAAWLLCDVQAAAAVIIS